MGSVIFPRCFIHPGNLGDSTGDYRLVCFLQKKPALEGLIRTDMIL
jgi:hypothetical protein